MAARDSLAESANLKSSSASSVNAQRFTAANASDDQNELVTPHQRTQIISSPEVVIVGAGLAGLTAAYCLHSAGVSVELVEAANRTGGRIHSMPGHGDLGPSWIWPPYQPVAARWAQALDVQADAPVERHVLPGQHGLTRLEGGPQALVDRLRERLPAASIHKLMRATPTWMAAQAKAVIFYETPFWRAQGLSGRVASQTGPLVEVHDHCGKDGDPATLFGFVGIDAASRASLGASLDAAIVDQLVHCFGEQAAKPVALHVEDWALNPYVCTDEDVRNPGPHPSVMPPEIRRVQMQDQLFMAGSETSDVSPGLIEGALHSGESTAAKVLAALRPSAS